MALTRATFFRFANRLPEKGDLAGMKRILAKHPEHREELLDGVRAGSDGYSYSAKHYTSWLTQFEAHASAKPVMDWLLAEGARPDLWVWAHLLDEDRFFAVLEADPSLLSAAHPMWGTPILENVPADWRPRLVAAGLDVDDPFSAILLADDARVLAWVDAHRDQLDTLRKDGTDATILLSAIIAGNDRLACALLDRGADPTLTDVSGHTAILMAVIWGTADTLQRLIDAGIDPHARFFDKGLMDWAERGPDVERIRSILHAAGVSPGDPPPEGP